MTIDETSAGTPVVQLSRDEHEAYVAAEVQRALRMTVDEFVRAYEAGQLDDADPAVAEVAGLLRLGQNGDQRPA